MKRKNIWFHASMLVLGILIGIPLQQSLAAETSSAGTKVGVLTCRTVPETGFSLIIHSTANVKCKFESTAGGSPEYYRGETGVGLGIDLRWDRETALAYAVFSADFRKGTYQLAGKYGGAGASATVGVGAGVQALVGGNNRSISLEPVISGSTGAGASAGITYLYLEPDTGK